MYKPNSMFKLDTIPRQLAHITVRIECKTKNNGISTGTGFYFNFTNSKMQVPVVITNRHVVENATSVKFQFTEADSDGKPIIGHSFNLEIPDFSKAWLPHPDPLVDLAAIPINPILIHTKKSGNPIYHTIIDKSLIPSPEKLNSLSALEEVVMIGYPTGLWDSHNNMPIFRKGITATHPCLDFDGKREFVIDAACFPGSSGSPVFRYIPRLPIIGTGAVKISGGDPQLHFLGVLYAGPQFDAEGKIKVVNVPTHAVPISVTSVMINLGYVIRSERLLEFESVLLK